MPFKDPDKRRANVNARAKAIREGRHIPKKGNQRIADDIICTHCGKPFYRSPANRESENLYCSRECMTKAYQGKFTGEKSPRWKGTLTKPCDHCKTPVTRPAWTWKDKTMTFCNRQCFSKWKSENWNGANNPSWRGGHPIYYGANWLRQSRECRRRDGHECRFCGIEEKELRRALNVHHIRPFRFFGIENYQTANRLSNLVSLCDTCHTYLEQFCIAGETEGAFTLLLQGIRHRAKMQIVLPEWLVPRKPDS